MTKEDRLLQAEVCSKYRDEGIIPTMQKIKLETGISLTTIATFMAGNSANEAIRSYLKVRFEKNLKPVPKDVTKLLAIWERDRTTED